MVSGRQRRKIELALNGLTPLARLFLVLRTDVRLEQRMRCLLLAALAAEENRLPTRRGEETKKRKEKCVEGRAFFSPLPLLLWRKERGKAVCRAWALLPCLMFTAFSSRLERSIQGSPSLLSSLGTSGGKICCRCCKCCCFWPAAAAACLCPATAAAARPMS